MSQCPWCDAENISGVDVCEECGQPLSELHLSAPLEVVEKSLLRDRLAKLQPKPAITIESSATLDNALQLLAKHRIGCVLVTELDESTRQSRICGIFSERDALFRIGIDFESLKDRPISELMTRNVQTLDAEAKVAYAVHMMDVGHYRHIPVVSDVGEAPGIISVRDILSYLARRMQPAEAS